MAQTAPEAVVLGRARVADAIGVRPAQLAGRDLPPADGTHRGIPWWLPATLHAWAETAWDDELLTEEEFRAALGCSDAEWAALQRELPEQFRVDPNRWWPKDVKAWIAARGSTLRADPGVLFLRDLPALTGLAHDSVRRYRWAGRLPDPDGFHRGRPWWHRRTISEWDATRNRDHAPNRLR